MNAHVLVLGEALIDVVSRKGESTEHPGGSPLNVAVGLAALDHGVDLATWFATDDRGDRLRELIERSGVRLVPGSDSAAVTPVALAEVDDLGQALYTFELDWRLPELPALDGYRHLHTGSFAATLAPGGDAVLAAVERSADGSTFSYDPNIRPALMGSPDVVLERIERLVATADVVKVSDEDLAWLYPGSELVEVVRHWGTQGPELIVVTRGPQPVLALLSSDDEVREVPRPAVDVADTVGAGDSFMAGLISGLLDAGLLGSAEAADRLRAADWTMVQPALERGVATSGITVSCTGAYAPSREELSRGQR